MNRIHYNKAVDDDNVECFIYFYQSLHTTLNFYLRQIVLYNVYEYTNMPKKRFEYITYTLYVLSVIGTLMIIFYKRKLIWK